MSEMSKTTLSMPDELHCIHNERSCPTVDVEAALRSKVVIRFFRMLSEKGILQGDSHDERIAILMEDEDALDKVANAYKAQTIVTARPEQFDHINEIASAIQRHFRINIHRQRPEDVAVALLQLNEKSSLGEAKSEIPVSILEFLNKDAVDVFADVFTDSILANFRNTKVHQLFSLQEVGLGFGTRIFIRNPSNIAKKRGLRLNQHILQCFQNLGIQLEVRSIRKYVFDVSELISKKTDADSPLN